MINVKTYFVNDIPLTDEILESNVSSFWKDIFESIKETNHILLLCKVKFTNTDQGYRTLGHLVKANFEDKEKFINFLLQRLTILNDSYVTHPICQMSFSYIIKPGKCADLDRVLLDCVTSSDIKFHSFNNMNLPITMDIETVTIDNKVTPYLINAYNGRHHLTAFNKNEMELFIEFIERLISEVGFNTIIYAHNLSTFDGVLLLKHLLNFGKVEPLLFNGKLISIKLKVEVSSVEGTISKTIVFKDSMLLLPYSLRKLCQSFNVEISKGYFPFNLTNIYYMNVFPSFESWTDITREKWLELKTAHGKNLWSFQKESIKYCRLDCVSLHQVISQFSELVFERFSVDARKALTLPALAMKIYKVNFIPKNTVYQLLGLPEYNIRQSYSGGAVDVYIPHNKISGEINSLRSRYKLLKSYDVNNLYPTIMAELEMPIGKPIAFDGNIRKVESDAYGFFYCKIMSPVYLEHPIIQRRIRTAQGYRTIAGLGCWEGWISSIEMDNAIKYGYQFDIIKGY